MSNSVRIATWNVKRPRTRGWKNNPTILRQIDQINADIWVLTETNKLINPGNFYRGVASTSIPNYHTFGENCSTIWSRLPIKQHLETFNSSIAVCVEVESPGGNLVVYGTLMAYANDQGPAGTSRMWEEHYQSIHLHGEDWAKLSQNSLFCVAGDFNEALSQPFDYGTSKGRELLNNALQQSNLVCVTAEEEMGFNIDQICLSEEWSKKVSDVRKWQAYNRDGQSVSDHHGVSVDVCFD